MAWGSPKPRNRGKIGEQRPGSGVIGEVVGGTAIDTSYSVAVTVAGLDRKSGPMRTIRTSAISI